MNPFLATTSIKACDHIAIDVYPEELRTHSNLTSEHHRLDTPDQFCRHMLEMNVIPKLLQDKQGQLIQPVNRSNVVMARDVDPSSTKDMTLNQVIEAYRIPHPHQPFWHLAQCPLTLEPFLAAVLMPDGYSYELGAIGQMLLNQNLPSSFRSPMNRVNYPVPTIVPNHRLIEISLYGQWMESKSVAIYPLQASLKSAIEKTWPIFKPAYTRPHFFYPVLASASMILGASYGLFTMYLSYLYATSLVHDAALVTNSLHWIVVFAFTCNSLQTSWRITRNSYVLLEEKMDYLCRIFQNILVHRLYRNHCQHWIQQFDLPGCYQRAKQAVEFDIASYQRHSEFWPVLAELENNGATSHFPPIYPGVEEGKNTKPTAITSKP